MKKRTNGRLITFLFLLPAVFIFPFGGGSPLVYIVMPVFIFYSLWQVFRNPRETDIFFKVFIIVSLVFAGYYNLQLALVKYDLGNAGLLSLPLNMKSFLFYRVNLILPEGFWYKYDIFPFYRGSLMHFLPSFYSDASLIFLLGFYFDSLALTGIVFFPFLLFFPRFLSIPLYIVWVCLSILLVVIPFSAREKVYAKIKGWFNKPNRKTRALVVVIILGLMFVLSLLNF